MSVIAQWLEYLHFIQEVGVPERVINFIINKFNIKAYKTNVETVLNT